MNLLLLVAGILLVLCLPSYLSEEIVHKFQLLTNGKINHEFAEMDEIHCIFTYAATIKNKKTTEMWRIAMKKFNITSTAGINSIGYSCHIENSLEHSIANFSIFSASVENLVIQSVEVFGNKGALLQDDEYVVRDNNVMQLENFNNNIVTIQMSGTL